MENDVTVIYMQRALTNGGSPYKCKCLLGKGNFLVFRASPLSAVSHK